MPTERRKLMESANDRAVGVPDGRVLIVHRAGALLVAATLATFGILGYAGGLDLFTSRAQDVAGMSSNGLLSTVSMVTAAGLVGAAMLSARLVSTAMIALGVLFLVSGLGHLFVIGTPANILAFTLPNVFFSLVVGFLLLVLGSYGRISGRIPRDNPYYVARHRHDAAAPSEGETGPPTPRELAVDRLMAAAERAAAQGLATPDQRARVVAMAPMRGARDRRNAWLAMDRPLGTPPMTPSG